MSDLEDIVRELVEIEPPEFYGEILGYNCKVWRNHFGAYCGYVEIFETHPLLKFYDYIEYGTIDRKLEETIGCALDMHGGMTYFERIIGGYIIGFDTAHYGDYVCHPATSYVANITRESPANYRHFDYVWAQLQYICLQLQFYAEKLR